MQVPVLFNDEVVEGVAIPKQNDRILGDDPGEIKSSFLIKASASRRTVSEEKSFLSAWARLKTIILPWDYYWVVLGARVFAAGEVGPRRFRSKSATSPLQGQTLQGCLSYKISAFCSI